MIPRSLYLSFVILAAAAAASAETLVLDLDPEETSVQIRFHATLHSVTGTLGHGSGRIAFDPATGLAAGEVTVDLRGAETGSPRRDRKMHQKILETERYPHAVLHLQRIDLPQALQQGSNDLQLHGTLDFHGVSRKVSLPATAELTGDRVSASAWLDVPYTEWGLDDPSFFVLRVAKVVEVEIRAAGRLGVQDEPPQALSTAAPPAAQDPPPR